MRFLIDTQLPKSLARILCAEGYFADHVLDLDMGQSADNDLWQHAQHSLSVIITKDEDFSEWIDAGRPGPAIVWLRIGNCSNQTLFTQLLPLMSEICIRLEAGERLIEVH